ncbi:hypothetical protein [Cardiobacterium hominis]|uniref:hypothetical protein n=1 Tax=Cardiobacterium hominis TaxID=2718 RepID=UPI00065FF4D7|nr:hypothetical protein [Cardiobacterium hominis]
MALKTHKQAPLPFVGQKRRFIATFAALLDSNIPGDGAGYTIVDAFGGSGLLAHIAKRTKPAAHVIYNDYDGYTERLAHIDDTNRLRHIIEGLTKHLPRNQSIPPADREPIRQAIRAFDGYRDLDCLASWLLFSGKQAPDLDWLLRVDLYNVLRQSDYPPAGDYLQGLEITRESYTTLLPRHVDNPRCLLVLDPPYVCTTQSAYCKAGYFGMVEFLRLMRLVRPPFIFFSSTRSELPAYLSFVTEAHAEGWERLAGYQTITTQVTLNKTSKYEDNLVYKFTP